MTQDQLKTTTCHCNDFGTQLCHKDIEKCRDPWLASGGVFITPNGQENQSLAKTKRMLAIVLARGTLAETKVIVHTFIADTDAYDVNLGMDFMGECLGYETP